MNSLLELSISMFLGRMQRPTGHALKRTGKVLKAVGQELEDLGDELIRTAPPVSASRTASTARSL